MTSLEASYRRCGRLNRRHGTSYYWATWLLPRASRRHVHALYAFCRHADDIVDSSGALPVEARQEALTAFANRFFTDLGRGSSSDPILQAVVDTVVTLGIDPSCFTRFLRSMTMDLSVARYRSFDDLMVYMDGSAAVIGEMMLPILGGRGAEVTAAARDLGVAFQLTNFLRDVAEDLDRGRLYLPEEDVRAFGAEDALLHRRVTAEWRTLMRFEIERARELYRAADRGVGLLPARSARCVSGARGLYSGILDRIEAAGYDVFTRRARVPNWRKVALGAGAAHRRGARGSGIP